MSKTKSNGAGRRVNVEGGWVVLRPMTVDDLEILSDSGSNGAEFVRTIRAAVLESGFENGKPLGEQPYQVLGSISREWMKREDEVALPPASAPPSVLPSTGK